MPVVRTVRTLRSLPVFALALASCGGGSDADVVPGTCLAVSGGKVYDIR
jgi:hypothetical protein